MSHVHIKNISTGDSIVMDSSDHYAADTVNDGVLNVDKTDGSSYMIFIDDERMLKTYLETALIINFKTN